MLDTLSHHAAGEFLARTSEVSPDSLPAYVAPSSDDLCRSWERLGLRPGDLILLSVPNGISLLEQVFGALLAGLVPALVAPSTPPSRMKELAKALEARAVVALHLNPVALDAARIESLGRFQVALLPRAEPSLTQAGEVVLLTSGTSGFS